MYWSLRRLLELVVLRFRPEREQEIEIRLLRHQLRVRGFKMSVHAAARWYSWINPPSRSRRLIPPRLGGGSAVVGVGREQRESPVRALAVVMGGVDA
jgi:hypothetical protein